MAMCVCKYVFNKHVIGWGGGGSGADSGIYYRGATYFGERSGDRLAGPGQRQELGPPEAPGN